MATTLTMDQILQLQSESKQRGQYDMEFGSFLNSGEAGVAIDLTQGTFAGKKAQSVKTGFENARKRVAEKGTDPEKATVANVRVILHEGGVYLIRQDLVAGGGAAAATEEAAA